MLITDKEYLRTDRENMRGGKGVIKMADMLAGETVAHLRLFSTITIAPGCSIGEHHHDGEAEIYYVLSGAGTVVDNGIATHISAGQTHICKSGSRHEAINDGSEPFVILAAIVTE